ncbi:MAG: SpoIIE family protein phosphatase [Desulfatitalea sp.]|nr:SpoIIE family protein phosphatase [Desulfatitalea sp.]
MKQKELAIEWLPLFEKGVFKEHPLLFEPFFRNTPAYLQRRYRQAKVGIAAFEETVRWPYLKGCGIQGGTHPGTGKSFTNIMTGARQPIYNSDCIYVNSARNIFAVSDSPGATTFSRTLFEELDQRLLGHREIDWARLIGHLDHDVARNQFATLALIAVDATRPKVRAKAFVAGDSIIFHGNPYRRRMVAIEGQSAFLGRLYANPKIIDLEAEQGDFFFIASDGITSIRQNETSETLESMLWKYLTGCMDRLIVDVMAQCNRIWVEETINGPRASFCGNDDCSILLIEPGRLSEGGPAKSHILGGCFHG